MQGCGKGGCFNILAFVVPQICDGMVGIPDIADTISLSLDQEVQLNLLLGHTTQNVGSRGRGKF